MRTLRTVTVHSGVNHINIKLETPQLDLFDALQFIASMRVFKQRTGDKKMTTTSFAYMRTLRTATVHSGVNHIKSSLKLHN